jgi:hypothetical protein
MRCDLRAQHALSCRLGRSDADTGIGNPLRKPGRIIIGKAQTCRLGEERFAAFDLSAPRDARSAMNEWRM